MPRTTGLLRHQPSAVQQAFQACTNSSRPSHGPTHPSTKPSAVPKEGEAGAAGESSWVGRAGRPWWRSEDKRIVVSRAFLGGPGPSWADRTGRLQRHLHGLKTPTHSPEMRQIDQWHWCAALRSAKNTRACFGRANACTSVMHSELLLQSSNAPGGMGWSVQHDVSCLDVPHGSPIPRDTGCCLVHVSP